MKKIILSLLIILSCEFTIGQTSLIISGDTWKYHNGSDPGATWKDVGFNDASWSSGLSELGYGDGDEATTIPTNYPTSYFRKVINIANPAIFTGGYNLAVKRDDGVVVYINGTEVYRDNMPGGVPTHSTWAAGTCGDDGGTWLSSTLAAGTLLTGNNTIAVEVHQVNAGSSDVTFNLTLSGLIAGVPTLTRGPYLQMGSSTGINIRWRTNVGSNTEVRYGTSAASLTNSVTNATSSTEHEITLTGLTPNTKYYYSIGTIGAAIQGDTNNYFFTHPTIGTEYELDVWVTGDCGTGYATQTSVMNQFLNHVGNKYIDAWLLVGDNAYNSGYDSEYSSSFFGPYQNSRLMKQTTIWPTPGNHDYYSAPNLGDRNFDYYKNFTMPSSGQLGGVSSGTEAFYSYNIGNVHFVSLDSYGEEAGDKMYDTTGAQSIWLKQDLATNNQKWTVLYWHHPPYTKGSHNSDTEGDLVDVRQKFIKMVERYHVDLIICGHSHCYERSKLMKGHYGNEASFVAGTHNISSSSAKYDGTGNSCPYTKESDNPINEGIVYVVSGSAGKFGGTSSGYPHNAMYYSNATNGGSTYLKFNGDRLDAKFISDGGIIQDQFTIMKDVNQVQTYNINLGDTLNLTSSWNGEYSWPHSGEITATVSVIPSSNTNYIVNDPYSCVRDSFKITVNIPTVTPNITAPAICEGTAFNINIPYTTTGYFWSGNIFTAQLSDASGNFSNPTVIGSISSTNSGTIAAIIPGGIPAGAGYLVRIVTSIPNSIVSSTIAMPISALPAGVASNIGPFCEGSTIQLNSSGGTGFTWTGPSLFSSPIQNPSILNCTAANAGTYTVSITNGTCSTTTTTIVSVNTTPSLTASNTGPYCPGATIQLNVNSASSYVWSGPDSFNSTLQNPTISSATVSNDGVYSVTITDINGCTATGTTLVVVSNSSSATANNSGPYCVGETISLNSISGGIGYEWAGPLSYTNQTENPSIPSSTLGMAGTYTVVVTFTGGCTASATTTININTNPSDPIITPTGSLTFCEGGSVILTSSYNNGNLWNTTEATNSIVVATSGSYTVTHTDANGCSASTSIDVTENPLPTVSLSGFGTICENYSPIVLSGGLPAGGSYSGTAVSAGQFDPSTSGAGTFNITYTYTDINSCSNSSVSPIDVLPCAGMDENSNQYLLSAFPNPFSDQITISYQLNNTKLISLEITDISGKVISRPIQKQTIEAGNHSIAVNAQDHQFKDGMYFIKLIADNKIELLKITFIGK